MKVAEILMFRFVREMKMVKRTLIAIILVACLANTLQAESEFYYFGPFDKGMSVKVDGKEEVSRAYIYYEPTICTIPVIIHVGMFVQIKDCTDKKIVLEQVNCSDIGKGSVDYPCYLGCEDFEVRANFYVKLDSSLRKDSDVIGDWSAYYDGGNRIPGDGDWHDVKLCVKAWKARIYKAAPGDDVSVGSVEITIIPDV